MTSLQKLRLHYQPVIPRIFHNYRQVGFSPGPESLSRKDVEEIRALFPKTHKQEMLLGHNSTIRNTKPLKVGVVFSGGQAAGGHNVIIGLYDGLKLLNEESTLIGFLEGPGGIVSGKSISLERELLAKYRNQGGFDLIGSGRTKIETDEQLNAALKVVQNFQLDGLVIIGGDDSNTNAAVLAEYFLQKRCSTKVIGVPKTIDGDLQNEHLQISFGFDTACKTYSEMIGNIARDALSAKKYTHIIKLMGRSASHIALECAFRTHPNLVFIGEEVAEKKITLKALVDQITGVIEKRAQDGKNYGVILLPEGLIEFIPEMTTLIRELNGFMANAPNAPEEGILPQLSYEARACYESLPEKIRHQLLAERDPHGNVQVSKIETEQLMIDLVGKELKKRQVKAHLVGHFFGYEGRAGFPSNFDCNYCTTLGYIAALLLDEGLTGYMAIVQNLHLPSTEWTIGALPIASLLHMEQRMDRRRPVIQKALVDLKGKPFQVFTELRQRWVMEDDYQFPGPIQFYGDPVVTDLIPETMSLAFGSKG